MALNLRQLLTFAALVLTLLLYNEFLVYYIVLMQCSWPVLHQKILGVDFGADDSGELKAMVIADTHILGKKSHWFDKLRREWQMERTFQTALAIFNPDIVFVLGDLLDEGKWASDVEFHTYLNRFHKMFRHSDDTDVQIVVGNHDIGFHYMVDEHKRKRFGNAFDTPSVRKFHKKDNIFVMVNSMAFEGDYCEMCREAAQELRRVVFELNCVKGDKTIEECRDVQSFKYTRPILMQHFPMYRKSDANCTGPDSAPDDLKYVDFKPTWDCLSESASQELLDVLQPRLIISAHTHHFCYRVHTDGTPEWTVPSFSWRNKKNPSFLLTTINNHRHIISKCYMPNENTVIYTYIVGGAAIFLWFLLPWCYHRRYSSYMYTYKIS